MAKRRTSGVQRRQRASEAALGRRIEETRPALPDWRLLAIGGLLLAGTLIVVIALLSSSSPDPDAGTAQPDDGSAHVAVGSSCRSQPASCGVGAVPYSSLPGSSGPHWVSPAEWGVYAAAADESQLIHNLEHGGIVIWYDPERVDAEDIAEMERYVDVQVASGISGRFKFIVSPWGGDVALPAPIVATAWRYTLELATADTDAIGAFARAHYGRAPEPNGGPGPPAG